MIVVDRKLTDLRCQWDGGMVTVHRAETGFDVWIPLVDEDGNGTVLKLNVSCKDELQVFGRMLSSDANWIGRIF